MDKATAKGNGDALKQEFAGLSKNQLCKICIESFAFNWKDVQDVRPKNQNIKLPKMYH